MATNGEMQSTNIGDERAPMLVRRFTDSLDGDFPLEKATVAAQTEDDRAIQDMHDERMRRLYEDRSRGPSDVDFSAADIARSSLEIICRKLVEDTKPSKLAKIGIHRKNPRVAANELMQQSMVNNFSELQHVISSLELEWRATHGPVYRNFQRLCNNLDAHKNVLAIFPQQNTYCAIFAGSLSLFVSAAVNHSEIAETISKTVADITVKASRCARLVQIITTQAMRELLSDLYAHVFQFYRDAMEWFLSSKTSKFFGSFNEKLRERFEKVASGIESVIDEMHREGNIAGLAMASVMNATITDMRGELIRQRQQSYDEADLAAAGRRMREMLRAIHQSSQSQQDRILEHTMNATFPRLEDPPLASGGLSRAQARTYIPVLERYVVGDEGYSILSSGKLYIAENDASSRLQDWIAADAGSTTLWISSPEISLPDISSAKAAAVTAIATAWQSELPMISHCCQRPRSFNIPISMHVEKAGLLGLLYSLVIQLLQFGVDDDEVEALDEDFELLDGTEGSWKFGLDIFSKLLKSTPQLSICVLHGLNDLVWSSGAEWCREFLDVLFNYQKDCRGGIRILLTTSGQSRVLPEYIRTEDRYFARKAAREILRVSSSRQEPSARLN